MQLSPNTLLHDRYLILELLGKGGMGAVYLSRDTALDQQVAVKINYNPQPESAEQFMREARLLASLRHPNLPRVFDYFVLDETQYLVMDYIPGEDLGTILEREGPQPLEKVLDWANQLTAALNYLHTQNPPVVHRDIKPANIKITPQNEVVLVDFGIAKASETAQVTSTGATGYTPGYAPPEQYGSARTGPYTDQYSLAATLYHLLSGHKPVDSVQRVLSQAVLTPINLLNPAIPPNVQAALEKALSLRPQDRFNNVNELNLTLHGKITAPTVRIQQPVIPPQEPASTVRKGLPGWIWAIAGVVLFLGAVVVIGGILLLRGFFTNSPEAKSSPTAPAAAMIQSTATETGMPTLAAASTQTPTAVPSQILEPSATITPEASPTTALLPLGGPGVIAFVSDRSPDGIQQIWTMHVFLDNTGRAYASEPEQLTFDPIEKSQPAWSPDGSQLLYSAPGTDGNGLDIWVVAADGSNPVNLTNRKGDDTDPSWSPDGKWIAFTNNGRLDGIRQIYLISPDGKETRRISYDLQEFSPDWTPDMKWLVFVITASSHEYLYMRAASNDFATPQPYDPAEIFGRLGMVADPEISPDGNWLAYTRVDGKQRRIFAAQFGTRGADIVKLTDLNNDREPAWSPDSRYLIFTSERDGNAEIYFMNANGQFQVNLTNHPGLDMQPAWQALP